MAIRTFPNLHIKDFYLSFIIIKHFIIIIEAQG